MVKSFASRLTLAGACLAGAFLLSGCGQPAANRAGANPPGAEQKAAAPAAGDTAWKFDKTIAEPLSATSTASADVKLGDLAANKVALAIPKGTFDADTNVTLTNPEDAPKYFAADKLTMLTPPIEIKAGDKPVRLNEPVTVSFKFDPAVAAANLDPFFYRVAYYDGSVWEQLEPKTLDLAKGEASFDTYHFSLFTLNQIGDDAKLTEQWIHSKTLDKQLKKSFNKVSDHVAEQIIDKALAKMGVSDESLKGKLLADVLKDDGYKDIVDSAVEGDVVATNQKIAILAASKLAEGVPASVYQGALKKITGGASDVEAASKAAANIAEGRYKDAAKIIGEKIADKFVMTAAVKIAVEVTQVQIDSWRNAEVEAAYKAYRNGSNGYFFSYNNEKNDFDTVWTQMRGVGRQLCIDAIKKENSVRVESGMPKLTAEQEDGVRGKVRESYRRQFETRAANDDVLQKEEEKLRTIMVAFHNEKFFDSAGAPAGLEKGLDYQGKLEVLSHFADKVMADTKRFELTDKNGAIAAKAIHPDDLVQAARFWFTLPDGHKLYAKFIKDRFNISLAPDLANLAGPWQNGTMTIKDVYVSDAFKAAAAAQKDKTAAEKKADPNNPLAGCDFAITPDMLLAMKGKTNPMGFIVTPTGANAGTLSFKAGSDKNQSIPFTYDNGTITATMTQQGATVKFEIGISEGATNYAADGPVTIDFANGQVKITGKVTATHALPAAKPGAKK